MFSCRYDKGKLAPKPTFTQANPTTQGGCGNLSSVSYSNQVQPVLNTNCVSCHDASAGIKLDSYSGTSLVAASGQLRGSLTGDPNYLKMPPYTDLDSCQLKTILNWISQGHLNN